jgi:CheY-like chemotaxis protein
MNLGEHRVWRWLAPTARDTSGGPAGHGMPGEVRAPVRRKILVVDDNIDMVRSMALLIRQMGHEVEYAINGYAALECAQRIRPDVIFLDLVLPDLDGWELARRMRKMPELKSVRIFAVTGTAANVHRQRSLDAGCDDHLLKPLDPDVVEALVRGTRQ